MRYMRYISHPFFILLFIDIFCLLLVVGWVLSVGLGTSFVVLDTTLKIPSLPLISVI